MGYVREREREKAFKIFLKKNFLIKFFKILKENFFFFFKKLTIVHLLLINYCYLIINAINQLKVVEGEITSHTHHTQNKSKVFKKLGFKNTHRLNNSKKAISFKL